MDRNVPAVLLIDGVCNLCNGVVRFVADREREPRLQFASLQSEEGQSLLMEHGLPVDSMETLVLLDSEGAHLRSEAALRLSRELRQPWASAWHLRWIPLFIRDWVYNFVSRNRYRWFGRQDVCPLPRADLAPRFLDQP